MRQMRRLAIVLVLLIVAALGFWYYQSAAVPSVQNAPVTVRVGYLRLLSAAPLYTAIREGYFRDENLVVETRTIRSGPEGNEALAAGNIDVAFSIVPSLIVAKVRGVPADLVSIYGATVDGPAVRDHRIVVAKGSPLSKASDLRGKKIAVVGWPGPTSDVLELLSFLSRNGLDQKQVTLVGMAHPEMEAALSSGTIDAGALAEPYITTGILGGKLSALSEGEGYYYDPEAVTEVTTYLARQSWLSANPDVAKRFLRAIEKGRAKASDRSWLIEQGLPSFNAKGNPPIDFVQLTSAQARELRFMPIKESLTVPGIARVADQLQRFGFVPKAPAELQQLIWTKQ